jgi:cobalt/nickel transport system permease protein
MLFAVHISDGLLSTAWIGFGFAGMLLLLIPAALRVRPEEISRIGLMTAAFFVSSLIHVRLGPASVHLLLTGLLGVILGRRAPLAVAVGLFWQVVLLMHGGYFTLGINTCIISIPALVVGWLFPRLAGEIVPGRARALAIWGGLFGVFAVVLTCLLNATVLILGGIEGIEGIVKLVFVAHLPVAVLEGAIVGTTTGYLARVKPEMLRGGK